MYNKPLEFNVKKTRKKYYEERHGLPAMWKELACMLKVNEYDRKQGNDEVTFSEEAISQLEERINIAELRAAEGEKWFK